AAASGVETPPPAGEPPRRAPREIRNREFDDREKIVLLLSAHCDPATKEDLLATSMDAEQHIKSVLDDEAVLDSVRMRALEALAFFSTPENIASLRDILHGSVHLGNPMMLAAAIRAYAKVAGEAAAPEIEPFLTHENDQVRLVAIASLKRCPGPAALDILKRRYGEETNRFFQTRLRQAIDGHCKGPAVCEE
ncbi:MAG: HEAT repeat domain-containing protein, partial [Proteobacteria bacterium]|nr:HEAT repeat domain-containing protein [Pseudomonadota bacterium]